MCANRAHRSCDSNNVCKTLLVALRATCPSFCPYNTRLTVRRTSVAYQQCSSWQPAYTSKSGEAASGESTLMRTATPGVERTYVSHQEFLLQSPASRPDVAPLEVPDTLLDALSLLGNTQPSQQPLHERRGWDSACRPKQVSPAHATY